MEGEEKKGRVDFPLNKLKDIVSAKKPDGQELKFKDKEEQDEELQEESQEEIQEGSEESQEDEAEEVISEDSEELEEEGDSDSEEESDESEEDLDTEEEIEDSEDELEEDSEESELEDEESDEELEEGDDSDEDEPIEEFNVYDFTEGVFESKEQLKSYSDLLKDNPELKGMLDFYKENGTLLPYLQATQVKVDELSDIEILRQDYFEENSEFGLSPSEMEEMFRDDVLSKYRLDDEDEKVSKIAKIRFKKEANKARAKFKEEQQKLKLPIERDAIKEMEKAESEKQEKLESERNKLGYQIRKQVNDGNLKVKVDSKNHVNMKVSPKKMTELISDLQAIDIFKGDDGNYDLRRMAMVANPDAFIESVSQTYKSEGKQEFVNDKLKNRKPKGKKKVGKVKEETKKLTPFNMTAEEWKKVRVDRA